MFQLHGGYSLLLGVTFRLLRLGELDGSCPAFGGPCRSLGPDGRQRPVSPVGWKSTPRICGIAVVGTNASRGAGDEGVSDRLCLGPQ